MKNKELDEYRKLLLEKEKLEERIKEIEEAMLEIENMAHTQLCDEIAEFETFNEEFNYEEEIEEYE